ncbi:hypothetical protein PENTCL1PPCAC_3675, partial [Pristionchus entomophagus]
EVEMRALLCTALLITSATPDDPAVAKCGDYTLMENPTDGTKPCLKIYTDPLTWDQTQHKCASEFASLISINSPEEEKYFWRTAVSNKMVEGMHIGAHQLTDDISKWTWVDGEVPLDVRNWTNSHLVPGIGKCSAMQTDSTYATWINEDCDKTKLPFICRRIDYTTVSKDCPIKAPNAGEDIFSPGFPNSDTPCSYDFVAAKLHRIQLEVITMVASHTDLLEIWEGPYPNHTYPIPLYSLNGTNIGVKYESVLSNEMKVVWKPNGRGDGRNGEKGFRIRYTEVSGKYHD